MFNMLEQHLMEVGRINMSSTVIRGRPICPPLVNAGPCAAGAPTWGAVCMWSCERVRGHVRTPLEQGVDTLQTRHGPGEQCSKSPLSRSATNLSNTVNAPQCSPPGRCHGRAAAARAAVAPGRGAQPAWTPARCMWVASAPPLWPSTAAAGAPGAVAGGGERRRRAAAASLLSAWTLSSMTTST